MAGTFGLADVVNLTNQETESDPRNRQTSTLQIHHTAYPNDAGSRALMDRGGRTVSANFLLLMAAVLMEVVLVTRRAYTSATSFDHESITVEVVNQTAGPGWEISEAQRMRLARLAVELFRLGLIRGLFHGIGGIIGHSDVPGTYATACPGPDMRIARIVELANYMQNGGGISAPKAPKGSSMDITFYSRVRPDGKGGVEDSGDWTIGGVSLFVDPDNDPEVSGYVTYPGFWATNDGAVAERWGRQFSFYPPETLAVRLGQDQYEAQQAMLADLHEKWVKGMRAAFGFDAAKGARV